MSRDSNRRRTFAAVAAAAACCALPQTAGAYETQQSAAEVRAYWTEERMESAIPADELLRDVESFLPTDDLGLGSGEPRARRGNAQAVKHPRSKPFRTHGKVFFTSGGVEYVCSGTSTKAKTKSLVVTAGHCIYSQATGYASNFMFAPAYDNGPSKFGEWVAKKLKAAPKWEANENISYDVGMATVGKLKGKKLARRVGARGIAFGKGRNLRFDVFGYPAEDDFNGNKMYRCDSPAQGKDNGQPKPEPTRIDCDMTGGSSGGGWVVDGKVNSVVSYGYECTIPIGPLCNNPERGKLFGPYFGGEIKKLYRSQQR